MASTRLTKTFSSSGNRNKWTISLWVKRSGLGSTQTLFACHQNSNYKTRLEIASDDELYFNDEYNGNTNGRIVSNAKLRDTNAWYHIVGIWDKDNSTSGDKIRFYINGERITSFSDTGNAPANASTLNTDSLTHEIGAENNGNKFDGLMSHIHFCDGYAYEPSNFGSTDSTTGEWKINTNPSVSYGTNGFFILKNGNSVTDQSPNTNNWTIDGTLTKTEDNPSNIFATMNPLNHYEGQTFTNGNTNVQTISGNGSHKQFVSSLGVSSGKFYWELKNHLANTSSSRIGISSESVIRKYTNLTGSGGHVGDDPESYAYVGSNGYKENNDSQTSYGNSFQSGDILMVALDMDNNKVYFGKNGTWQNSGDPTSGSTGTGAAFTVTAGLKYYPACSIIGGGGEAYQFNFGNGYFKTTAVSSAGTNANGLGIFEYNVPTGYTALCTKGLNL